MYQLTVKALFVEATAFVVCGFLVGLIYGDWRAVVAAQALLIACEGVGYLIEGRIRRRHEQRQAACATAPHTGHYRASCPEAAAPQVVRPTARPNHSGKERFPPWLPKNLQHSISKD